MAHPQHIKDSFAEWFFEALNSSISNSTGLWDGQPHQDTMRQLGGAFHIQHVYQCFGVSWPDAKRAVDTTLEAQHTGADGSGMWGYSGNWTDRDQWGAVSSCIDLDGVYSAARGSIVAAGGKQPFYKWDNVKQACKAYLRTAEFLLNNSTFVLGRTKYAGDTHLLHGPMYAVAECQQHFPELVKTIRPWR